MSETAPRTHLLAVLMADAVGYSRLMALDETATVVALDAARALFREQIVARAGRVVDTAGDSVLAVFDSTASAVEAALSVQQAISALTASAQPSLTFRIGVHAGDVIEKPDGTVYGDGVNLAARLQAIAKPGEVAVSHVVYGMVARTVDAVFEDSGHQVLKNIANPVHTFRARLRREGEPRPRGEVGRAGNLPSTLPRLIGRSDDVARLVSLVRANRLVSVVGAGGIGKTRVAQATARATGHEYDGGAWMIELAPLADGSLLPAIVAQTLGVTLSSDRDPQAQLMQALRNRQVLLVLDNCEHLVEAVSAFVELLLCNSESVSVLVTSQELLRINEEHVFRLSPLSLPETSRLADAGTSGAVSLLVHRIQATEPSFALGEQNAADLVEICHRLDGMPLAIELAAARVPLLGVAGVRHHLSERFRVLTGGSRTAMRRHQTLRAALEWSHSLLNESERTVFRRLGVFVGAFSMRAAQLAASDTELDSWEVLEQVGALVDKSLIVVVEGDPTRYRLLESMRSYALELLAEATETDEFLRRHAETILALVQPSEDVWVRRSGTAQLGLDVDNVRAALLWSAQIGSAQELNIRLASVSAPVWVDSGNRVEGLHHCQVARGLLNELTPPLVEAGIQHAWMFLSHPKVGSDQLSAGGRAVALYRQSGSPRQLYRALAGYAIAAALSGQLDLSAASLEEMSKLHDESWPEISRFDLLLARSLFLWCSPHQAGGEARELAMEMLRIARNERNAWFIGTALSTLMHVSRRAGNLDEAITYGREALAIRREAGAAGLGLGFAIGNLSDALAKRGDIAEAISLAHEATKVCAEQGLLWALLPTIATIALARGRVRAAGLAFGRAKALFVSGGAPLSTTDAELLEDVRRELEGRVGPINLERLVAEGHGMIETELVDLVLADGR